MTQLDRISFCQFLSSGLTVAWLYLTGIPYIPVNNKATGFQHDRMGFRQAAGNTANVLLLAIGIGLLYAKLLFMLLFK